MEVKDLKEGMVCPGIVTNVTNFGAFVDIGVHQDGLVHISHLADRFIKDPNLAVAVQQKVKVTVVEVDVARKRIALSMKSDPFGTNPPKPSAPKEVKQRQKSTQGAVKKRPQAPAKKEASTETMEAKLAQLMNKFKK